MFYTLFTQHSLNYVAFIIYIVDVSVEGKVAEGSASSVGSYRTPSDCYNGIDDEPTNTHIITGVYCHIYQFSVYFLKISIVLLPNLDVRSFGRAIIQRFVIAHLVSKS